MYVRSLDCEIRFYFCIMEQLTVATLSVLICTYLRGKYACFYGLNSSKIFSNSACSYFGLGFRIIFYFKLEICGTHARTHTLLTNRCEQLATITWSCQIHAVGLVHSQSWYINR